MKAIRTGKKIRALITVLILTLVFVNISTLSIIAEPAYYEETFEDIVLTDPGLVTEYPVEPVYEEPVYVEPVPEPVPEVPAEPVYEEPVYVEPVPQPQPEIPVTEPVVPQPEVPVTEPVVPQPEVPVTEPVVPQPEIPVVEPVSTDPAAFVPTTMVIEDTVTQNVTDPEPVTQVTPETQPQTTPEAETEAETEPQTEAEQIDNSIPQPDNPNAIVIYGTYTPVTISYANESEIANSVGQYLEENDETLTETQKSILHACVNTLPASAAYGAQWISRVYHAAGISVSGNANEMWREHCMSSDRDELEPGMLVAVARSNSNPETWGYFYGRAGIYVGDDKIVESSSWDGCGVKVISTLDDWIAAYDVDGTVRWGYPGDGETEKEKTDAANKLGNVTEKRDGVPLPWASYSLSPEATGIQIADMAGLTSIPVTPDNFGFVMSYVPTMTREELVALGTEMYGLDARWIKALIGTTAREGYAGDPYLYYAWACAMLNVYRYYSADALYGLMDPWGGAMCPACGETYGEHGVIYGCAVHPGYATTSEYVLQCVFLALINRDYRILEVDGMIDLSSAPSHVGLIYNSPVYNCQVWTYIGG